MNNSCSITRSRYSPKFSPSPVCIILSAFFTGGVSPLPGHSSRALHQTGISHACGGPIRFDLGNDRTMFVRGDSPPPPQESAVRIRNTEGTAKKRQYQAPSRGNLDPGYCSRVLKSNNSGWGSPKREGEWRTLSISGRIILIKERSESHRTQTSILTTQNPRGPYIMCIHMPCCVGSICHPRHRRCCHWNSDRFLLHAAAVKLKKIADFWPALSVEIITSENSTYRKRY